MGKIVKFCSSCEEGFAEKFGFCPNCGQPLQTFEMNRVEAAAPPVVAEPVRETFVAPPVVAEPVRPAFIEPPAVVEPIRETFVAPPVAAEPVTYFAPRHIEEPVHVVEEPVIAKPVEAAPVFEAPVVEKTVAASTATKVAAPSTSTFVRKPAVDVDRKPAAKKPASSGTAGRADDGGFYVTVIEEKNGAQRNGLLIASLFFMMFVLVSAIVINLFSKDLEVGSINDDIFNAVIVDTEPMTIEEEKQQKEKKDAGGGGGGGRDEKEEVTKGDLADQALKPTRPPDAKVFRSDNFELKTPPPQTEGPPKVNPKENDRWGDPNGRFASFSNGTGTGGGQGSGTGTGQGSGRGTGNGSGTGSGSGGGLGNGIGNGTGSGEDGDAPPPKAISGVTAGLKIVSKPKPGYTDAARVAMVQGTVLLRVTFLASGQIGSISPVKGLPNGLTEQAIACAKRIVFEPAKNNGIALTVTKQVEYSFSIY